MPSKGHAKFHFGGGPQNWRLDCDLLSALATVRRVFFFFLFGRGEARKVCAGREFYRKHNSARVDVHDEAHRVRIGRRGLGSHSPAVLSQVVAPRRLLGREKGGCGANRSGNMAAVRRPVCGSNGAEFRAPPRLNASFYRLTKRQLCPTWSPVSGFKCIGSTSGVANRKPHSDAFLVVVVKKQKKNLYSKAA